MKVTPPLSWCSSCWTAFHLVAVDAPSAGLPCHVSRPRAWSPWPVKTSMRHRHFFRAVFADDVEDNECRYQQFGRRDVGATPAARGMLGATRRSRRWHGLRIRLPWPQMHARAGELAGLPRGAKNEGRAADGGKSGGGPRGTDDYTRAATPIRLWAYRAGRRGIPEAWSFDFNRAIAEYEGRDPHTSIRRDPW